MKRLLYPFNLAVAIPRVVGLYVVTGSLWSIPLLVLSGAMAVAVATVIAGARCGAFEGHRTVSDFDGGFPTEWHVLFFMHVCPQILSALLMCAVFGSVAAAYAFLTGMLITALARVVFGTLRSWRLK